MLRTMQSPPKNNYFAPEWRFDFYDVNLQIDTEKVAKVILDKEFEIIKNFPSVAHDGGTGLGPNSLTARFENFNVFKWTETKDIYEKIIEQYHTFLHELNINKESAYISGWANVMRFGEKIQPHWHSCFPDSYVSGHLVVQANNTATYYQNPYNPNEVWTFENLPGNLTLFPNHLIHWTDMHNNKTPRITIAFDIVTENYIKENPALSDRYIKI